MRSVLVTGGSGYFGSILAGLALTALAAAPAAAAPAPALMLDAEAQIGRASCRERV